MPSWLSGTARQSSLSTCNLHTLSGRQRGFFVCLFSGFYPPYNTPIPPDDSSYLPPQKSLWDGYFLIRLSSPRQRANLLHSGGREFPQPLSQSSHPSESKTILIIPSSRQVERPRNKSKHYSHAEKKRYDVGEDNHFLLLFTLIFMLKQLILLQSVPCYIAVFL